FAGDDLGDGVGEIAIVFQSQIDLDELEPAALADDDQIPRMGSNRLAARPGDEDKVNGFLQDSVWRNLKETSVLKKGGVQGVERLVREVGRLGQVRLDRFALKGVDKIGANHAASQGFADRLPFRKMPVDKYRAVARGEIYFSALQLGGAYRIGIRLGHG